ncbi:tRNA (N6-isopentenyl adenosine(37)-C2)-methylthiotransferase MiaB [Candidatus Desantisbacteria bacterium]|nr:tRNA (N6-isopentenyl adenosine(37)-C2)-methylthiotransferase MiaB [Candidatus Desantisbacteria bacterium]
MIQKKMAYIITYGCQMNKYDSDVISRILEDNGYNLTDDEECASLVLINTCSIRKHAEDKVLSKLGELSVRKKLHEDLRIIVSGCMAQRLGEKLVHRFPEIDFVIGTGMIAQLPNILKGNGWDNPLTPFVKEEYSIKRERVYTGESSCLYPDMSSLMQGHGLKHENGLKSFISVILGCDNYCSYCIVPYVRGKPRSRERIEIIREIELLVDAGCKEITLLGQNILAYGRDINESFGGLLRDISSIDGLMRIRFLTSHPRDITKDLIDLFPELPKVCQHFHLPVQSGSDHVLRLMRRGYTVDHYKRIVEGIRQVYQSPSITTDLIVGFPGETVSDFEDTMKLVKEIGFDTAFCFKYSPREGTPACKFHDQLPEEEKTRRLKELLDVQKAISMQINQALVGSVQEVLLDEKNPKEVLPPAEAVPLADEGSLLGRTRGDKVVVVPAKIHRRGQVQDLPLQIGDIGMVRIVSANNWSLKGVFVDE